MLARAAYFFPIFEFHLQEAGLPEMLKYLPVVESNLRTKVVSSRGAAGLWQFMPATARYYGLQVDEEEDQRLDPQKASEAASIMLKELFEQFDDWFLALAAYNCGPSRVKRAIRKANSRDFDQIKAFLPKQTRQYTSKFLAALHLGYSIDQLDVRMNPDEPIIETLPIKSHIPLEQLAKAAKISEKPLEHLNPGYQSQPIHSNQSYALRIPAIAKAALASYIEETQAAEATIELAAPAFLSFLPCQRLLDCQLKFVSNNTPEDQSEEDPIALTPRMLIRRLMLI